MAVLSEFSERYRLKHIATRLADFLLPPHCMGCGVMVSTQGGLCPSCWSAIDFIERPFCELSGLPFAYDPGEAMVRPEFVDNPPPYAKARSVMYYNEASARLVLRYKFADRMEAAPAFAHWMVRAGAELLDGADLILPVPLHRKRLFSRRFNQSAELARRVARLAGLPFAPNLLVRARATRPQIGLSGTARRRNVAGAFRLADGAAAQLAEKVVVLVDDVMTTGATVEACARALNSAGAREVRVLSLARVVPDGKLSI